MLKRFLTALMVTFVMVSFATAGSYIVDGLGSSGAAVPAQLNDLSINPGNLGDVLVFPYYNVRNQNGVAYVRIVNTSDRAVVGKLRLREGKESEEILDFIVCLSAHDQFTFWIADPALLGLAGDTAVLLKDDATGLKGDDDTVVAPAWDIARTRTTTSAGKTIEAERTFEGYVEFFGLNSVDEVTFESVMGSASDKVQACLDLASMKPSINDVTVTYGDVPNALMGEAYLFNLKGGNVQTYAYKAVAFANFQDHPMNAGLTTDYPLFKDAKAGLPGVNYVLTKTNFYVFYDLQNYLMGKTDVILNFVTKKENVDNNYFNYYSDKSSSEQCARGNYTNCCVEMLSKVYDDAENTPTSGIDFSPVPPGQTPKVCYEVTYMPVGAAATPIFDTGLKELNIVTNYELGWAKVTFTNSEAKTTRGDSTVYGEPVLVYELQSYFDGTLSHMLPVAYDVNLASGSGEEEGETSGPSTVINGVTVTCDTVCSDEFSGIGNIQYLIQCEDWQNNNCEKK